MKRVLVVLLAFFASLVSYSQSECDLPDALFSHLDSMNYRKALREIELYQNQDSTCEKSIYLQGLLRLFYGDVKVLESIEKLKELEYKESSLALSLWYGCFLGDAEYRASVVTYDSFVFADWHEIAFLKWLVLLDSGDYEKASSTVRDVSAMSCFSCLPYKALFHASWNHDYNDAIKWLDSLELFGVKVYESRYRQYIEQLILSEKDSIFNAGVELEYVDCGPGMGIRLNDCNDLEIDVELDTGTGYNLFTIHNLNLGTAIAGDTVFHIKNGIWYNYMEKPEDLFFKMVSFNGLPDSVLLGYFDSDFSKADGCFSPFVFKNYALMMDAPHQRAALLSKDEVNQIYSNDQQKIVVPYIVRNGWVFIPVTIADKEVFMMLETGSRDVNLNLLSVRHLGVQPYKSTVKWRGNDYPVEKVDFEMTIGCKTFKINGGFVSGFVLGNHYTGLGCAGDIGPGFLKNYCFVIDVFNQNLILYLTDDEK